jgi:hypothetical protein
VNSTEQLVAQIRRNTWWAYYGTLPEAPYVRIVIEVVVGDRNTDYTGPSRAQRHLYIFGGDAINGEKFWLPLEERLQAMLDDEFQELVRLGLIVPLSANAGAERPNHT